MLRTLYELTGNYGAAIILFAVVVKTFLLFFNFKSKKGTLKQQRLAPKLKELQKQCGSDKQKYQQAVAKLYQDEGASPMGGCLWMLVPLPILFALFAVVREPLKNILQMPTELIASMREAAEALGQTYSANDYYVQLKLSQFWLSNTEALQAKVTELASYTPVNFNFIGLDFAEIPHMPWSGGFSWSFLIPFISAATALLSMLLTQRFSKQQAPQGNMMMMMLLSPLMSLWIGFYMPVALGVYWITQYIVGIVQEYFLCKHFNKVLDEEDVRKTELEERRRMAEAKQREEDRQRKAERLANQKHKPKKYKLQNQPKPRNQPKKNLPEASQDANADEGES